MFKIKRGDKNEKKEKKENIWDATLSFLVYVEEVFFVHCKPFFCEDIFYFGICIINNGFLGGLSLRIINNGIYKMICRHCHRMTALYKL